MYKCIKSVDSYYSGQEISLSEYNSLSYDAKQCFTKSDDSSSNGSGESPVTIMTDGHLGLNLGSGLSLDMSDGSLGLNLGGGLSLNL